eukprot:PhF_6_TR38150/c0_g1_i1/m.56984
MSSYSLEWSCGKAEIHTLGAMLGPVTFQEHHGSTSSSSPVVRTAQPFAVAPWPDDETLPGILRKLRGEFPCVPFGGPCPRPLPSEWVPPTSSVVEGGGEEIIVDSHFHGLCSNAEWTVVRSSPSEIVLEIIYPEDSPIVKLVRTISVPHDDKPTLSVSLRIVPRRTFRTTLALHPIFRLSDTPNTTNISVGEFKQGIVFPLETEPGVSKLTPGKGFHTLEEVGLHALPLPYNTEEFVQLCGVPRGRIEVRNTVEGYTCYVSYDPLVFPSVLMWVSNRGRSGDPWCSRFLGVGVEPTCSAFDLGPKTGAWSGNPITQNTNVPTSLRIGPDVFETKYNIGVEWIS